MQTCKPQLADKKVVDGVILHFISVSAQMHGDEETLVVEGLDLGAQDPSFAVVSAFLDTAVGQSAAAVVATTITAIDRSRVVFVAQRLPSAREGAQDDAQEDAAPLALRFDFLVRQ